MDNKRGYARYAVIALFVILAVISAILFPKVRINYSISDYLDESTDTKISLGIIEREFGMTGSLNVIIRDTDAETAKSAVERIKAIPNVLNVMFDESAPTSFKDGNALITVMINGDDTSDEAAEVYESVKTALAEYKNVSYSGGVASSLALRDTIMTEMVFILAVSLVLVAIILLITSKSWLEPIILLFASGFAVVINLGTNIIFGEISYITNSVAAILQLALSIDYSIVMLHTYRAEKEKTLDSVEAMLNSIKKVSSPVSASALTTVAGLIALLFMTFTIGFDIGIVLIKGIVISAVTALTLLPALILVLEKPMKRLEKKEFIPKGELFCKLSFKCGKVIAPVALIVVVGAMLLQTLNVYSFSEPSASNESDTFGNNSTVLVLYKKGENDFENEKLFAERLSQYKKSDGASPVNSFTAYSNTVREEYDVDKAVNALGVNRGDAEMLFAMYHLTNDGSCVKLTPSQLAHFTAELLKNDPDVQGIIDYSVTQTVDMLLDISELMSKENTAQEFYDAAISLGGNIELDDIKTLYNRYGKKSIVGHELVSFALDKYSIIINAEAEKQLEDMLTVHSFFADTEKYGYKQMTKKLNGTVKSIKSIDVDITLSEDIISGVYVKYAVNNGLNLNEPVMAYELLDFLATNVETNELLRLKINDEMKAMISDAQTQMKSAEELFIGNNYSRMLLTVDLPVESKDTTEFVEHVSSLTKEIFGFDSYVAGELASTYDLQMTFASDNTFISIFTVVSVFLIVMLIFRSLSLPVILVAVIQGAIWIALSIWLAIGEPLFFMSYIMSNCILMGATIDYGILMSSNYVSLRKTLDKREALRRSVDAAMPTVFSSGTIMTVCGFVIGAIASQRAISSTGTLIGIGTLVSVTMITVVLPSALCLLDGFIMKLSLKKKN
ncbi:MAG: MMPL family transporter [Clostridia bacterium]|nr:MMPL family transporter [Clostridia bacterium]